MIDDICDEIFIQSICNNIINNSIIVICHDRAENNQSLLANENTIF